MVTRYFNLYVAPDTGNEALYLFTYFFLMKVIPKTETFESISFFQSGGLVMLFWSHSNFLTRSYLYLAMISLVQKILCGSRIVIRTGVIVFVMSFPVL